MKGDEGIHGADGFQGPVGISGYEIKVASSTVNSSSFKYVSAYCSSGKKAIGGGAIVSDTTNEPVPVSVTESAPSNNGTSWRVRVDEIQYTGHQWMIQAHVICAKFDG